MSDALTETREMLMRELLAIKGIVMALDAREEKAEPAGEDDERCPECGNSWRLVRGMMSAERKADARIAELELERDDARAKRDEHFTEIKRAQAIIDAMKLWRQSIYNQSVSADWIAVLLSEHPDPESRSYVAVRIAEQCDKAIANARAFADAHAEKAEAALAERDARIEALERERRQMLPVSDDGKYVFVDGHGLVELDFGEAMRERAEKAEAALADLRGRVEKATSHIQRTADRIANRDDMPYGERDYRELRGAVRAALVLLSPEGEAKGEAQPTCICDAKGPPMLDCPVHGAIQPPRDADPVPAPSWRPVNDEAKTGERVLLWVCSRGSIRRGIAQIGWWGHHREFGQTWLLRPDQPIDVDAVRLWMPIEKPGPARSAGITQGAHECLTFRQKKNWWRRSCGQAS